MTDGNKNSSGTRSQAVTPWTSTITVRWRPTPKIYDCRISLLTLLEDQKRLQAFKVDDDTTHAFVSDEAELTLTPRSISLAFSNGFPDGVIPISILDQVLEMLKPRVTRYYGHFQYLIGLDGFSDYGQARAIVASKIFGFLGKDISLLDTAILLDGELDGSDPTFTAEFGIVDKAEAAERLSNTSGRVAAADEPDFSHIFWEEERSLPEIALYVSSRWHDHEEIPADLTGHWLFDRFERYRIDAGRLATKLYDHAAPS